MTLMLCKIRDLPTTSDLMHHVEDQSYPPQHKRGNSKDTEKFDQSLIFALLFSQAKPWNPGTNNSSVAARAIRQHTGMWVVSGLSFGGCCYLETDECAYPRFS